MDDRPQDLPPGIAPPCTGELPESVEPHETGERSEAVRSPETDSRDEADEHGEEVGEPRQIAALDPPMLPLAIGGLVVWAVVGLSLLPFRHQLADNGNGSWPWICLAGFVIGIPGLLTMIRHDANRRRRRSTSDNHPDRDH